MATHPQVRHTQQPHAVRRALSAFVGVSYCAAGCAQTDLDVIRTTAPGLNPSAAASFSASAPSASVALPAPTEGVDPAPSVNPVASMDGGVAAGSTSPFEAGAPADSCGAEAINSDRVYRIYLPQNQGCLQATKTIVPPITGAQHGNALRLSTPCVNDQSTLFTFTTILLGGFQITSVLLSTPEAPTVLDVLMGETVDGTPVILYPSNGFANQRFSFVEREPGLSSVSPTRALDLCLTLDAASLDGSLLVQTCVPSNALQEWQVLPMGCSPSTN
jgi:hypothetical protein